MGGTSGGSSAEPVAGGRETFVRVRVWDLPVRLIHWLLVLDLLVLSATGFLIGTPAISPGGGTYWMSWTRTVHEISAYGFIALIMARVIWHFRSPNPWSRWTEWIPSNRERLGQIVPSMRFYGFLTREAPPVVGHNPLAGLTYCVLYTMFTVEIVTGLVLWGVEGTGWASWLTGWLLHLVPLPTIRLIHHLIMWLAWGFMIHHLYSAILVDRVEGTGVLTSIFSGNKFLPRHHAPGAHTPDGHDSGPRDSGDHTPAGAAQAGAAQAGAAQAGAAQAGAAPTNKDRS